MKPALERGQQESRSSILQRRVCEAEKLEYDFQTSATLNKRTSDLTLNEFQTVSSQGGDVYAVTLIFLNASSKSAIISSMCSIPTETRIRSCLTPPDACSFSVSCWCVVEAG